MSISGHQKAASNRAANCWAWLSRSIARRSQPSLLAPRAASELGRVDVALDFSQRDRSLREPSIVMKDRVVRILPALIGQAQIRCPVIFCEAVAVGIARPVDPAKRRFDRRP